MSNDVQYLTAEKYDELNKELENLKVNKRKEIAEHLEYAKRLGDLSENAEYHQAREDQAEVEARIGKLENLLKNSVMIGEGIGTDVITIGSTFRLQKEGDNKSFVYTLVGSEESDTSLGKISNLSPLGLVLVGHKKGDKVTVSAPKGKVSYSVEDIIK
jgi:transcription elongation factor GreA